MSARSILPAGRRLRILKRPPESILPSSPRPARRDCHGRLVEALLRIAGADAVALDSNLRPWCSATFVGARHEILLGLGGPDAGRRGSALADSLPETEFRIPGHVIADLAVDSLVEDGNRARLALSVLSIEDW